jgi:hypothetical protein
MRLLELEAAMTVVRHPYAQIRRLAHEAKRVFLLTMFFAAYYT